MLKIMTVEFSDEGIIYTCPDIFDVLSTPYIVRQLVTATVGRSIVRQSL